LARAHLDLLDELALVGVSKLLQKALLHDVGEDWQAAYVRVAIR
jgi:hypothetical protein